MQVKLICTGLIAKYMEQESSSNYMSQLPKDKLNEEEKETLKIIWSCGPWVECNSELEFAIASRVAQMFKRFGGYKPHFFNQDQCVIRKAFEIASWTLNDGYSSETLDNFWFIGVFWEEFD